MNIQIIDIPAQTGTHKCDLSRWSIDKAQKVNVYHQGFPEYERTPLHRLSALARQCGVKEILVKDESYRFGLNAFKVLGGSYAIGSYIASLLGKENFTYADLISDEAKCRLQGVTFITATDGNHGRGVAWTAGRLGCDCVVYMPKGTAKERLDHIRKLGAQAEILDVNYDDAVRRAAKEADENGWVLVQDTSWDGYEMIPEKIMQGYMSMGYETVMQIEELNTAAVDTADDKDDIIRPTHIFLQAGVGAMAGAMTGFFTNYYAEYAGNGSGQQPKIIIVEPDKADCIFKTAQANDGTRHFVTTDMDTMMAGLACGEPCPLGWDVIKENAHFCASITDDVAAEGMRLLARPAGGNPKVISGESGAAGFSLAAALLTKPEYKDLKNRIGLDENSQILCISTEGATDLENYRKIVDG